MNFSVLKRCLLASAGSVIMCSYVCVGIFQRRDISIATSPTLFVLSQLPAYIHLGSILKGDIHLVFETVFLSGLELVELARLVG